MTIRSTVLTLVVAACAPATALAQVAAQPDDDSTAVRQALIVQDRYPDWSPDGERLVFDSNRTGVNQIFLVDAGGADPIPLTRSEAMNRTPVFSPDGEWIAFQSLRDGVPAIFVVRPDGTGLRKVTDPPDHEPGSEPRADDSHPRWAPDGRSIVFNRNAAEGNAEVFEIDADGTDLRQLTDWPDHDTYASVSPDGRHLLWRRITLQGGEAESGRNSEIFIANRDGTNARNLTNHPAFDGYPVWLPSGDGIVFASNRDGEVRLDFNVYVMRPDGSDVTRLTDLMPGVLQARPSVSPDGRAIVFNRDFPHDDEDRTVQLFVKRFDRPIAQLIGTSGTADADAAAADGAAAPVAANEGETAERCRGPEFRAFDFWIGEWEVRNAEGEIVGHNTIRPVARGCGLLENWRGATGGRGVSINTYDADRGTWTQRWVGAGSTLWLEGGPEDGRMVLAGTSPRSTPRGEVLDRISWTPLPDGRVRQVWRVSPDEGESWRTIFEGFYSPAGRADAAPSPAGGHDATAQRQADGTPSVRRSDDLRWRTAPSGAAFATIHGRPTEPGPFTLRMRMPADWEMRPHRHATDEHLTVLSGLLYMKFSSTGEAVELSAGSTVVVPAGRPMWAWTGDRETVIQVHGVGPFGTQPVE